MKNGSNAKPDRVKVYVKSLNKSATVRRVEDDPVWGKQFLVSTYSPSGGLCGVPTFTGSRKRTWR